MSDLRARIQGLLRPELDALSAYQVPDSRGLIKLDAMENPYSWPDEMIDEWLGRLRCAAINRYPDPSAAGVAAALRRTAAIPDGAALLLGNGSDELIQIILMALGGRHAAVLAPEPTFVMYRQLAVSLGLKYVGVPLASDFSLDMDAMRAAMETHHPAVVFLAYPNNPTGNLFRSEDIAEILDRADGLVVVDEAYLPFAGASFLPYIPDHDKLLVMRTLSKMGLAGLRLGYLVGAEPWISAFDKLRLPYNINVLTQISAEFALGRADVFDEQVRQILEERERLYAAISRMPGATAYPSRANFILFKLHRVDIQRAYRSLCDHGILVKSFHNAPPPLSECLRVTVGKPDENQRFLESLEKVLVECSGPLVAR